MTQQRDLLRAVTRDPNDDAIRLVYADWLDDHGDTARAEFVRAQVRLAATRHVRTPAEEEHLRHALWGSGEWRDPADTPERRELAYRCRELLDAYEATWLTPLCDVPRGERVWARGFVEGLHADAATLGRELFDTCPVRRLILAGQGGAVEALANVSAENALTALDLILCDIDPPALRRLAGISHLARLQEVSLLFNRLDDSCVELLCDAPFFRRLSLLRLGCNQFTEDGRDRLRERCGDRVSFDRQRHPERLITLADGPGRSAGGSSVRVGQRRDRTQLYMENRQGAVTLVAFDHAGDPLRVETRYAETEAADLGLEPGAIRVKRFDGVYDFPKGWADAFDQTDSTPAELEAQAAFMRRWLAEPAYRVGSCCGGSWFHVESGEVVSLE